MEVSFLIIGGSDAPGFTLVPDGHGGWKLVPHPGWNPEQMLELGSALEVVAAASRLKHPEVSQTILNSIGKLVTSEIAPVIGKQAGAGHVVVAVMGR